MKHSDPSVFIPCFSFSEFPFIWDQTYSVWTLTDLLLPVCPAQLTKHCVVEILASARFPDLQFPQISSFSFTFLQTFVLVRKTIEMSPKNIPSDKFKLSTCDRIDFCAQEFKVKLICLNDIMELFFLNWNMDVEYLNEKYSLWLKSSKAGQGQRFERGIPDFCQSPHFYLRYISTFLSGLL